MNVSNLDILFSVSYEWTEQTLFQKGVRIHTNDNKSKNCIRHVNANGKLLAIPA